MRLVYAHFGVLIIGIEREDHTIDEATTKASFATTNERKSLTLMPDPNYVIGSSGGTERAYAIAPNKEESCH